MNIQGVSFMNTKKKIATIIATTAAIAFATAPLTTAIAHSHKDKVKCYGVNSCKGKSKCKTAQNACKGKNSCKGKGYMMKTEKECKKMGGSTTEPAGSESAPASSSTESSSTGSSNN